MHWLTYSLAATLLLGIAASFYKLPSFKGYSSFVSTVWTNGLSVLLVIVALVFFSDSYRADLSTVSWYAIGWGMCFAITMLLQKILLKHVETNSSYPVTSSIGSIVTVLIGITLLSEHVSLLQALGIAIMLTSVFLYTAKGGSFPLTRKTVFLALGAIASSTAGKYIQKLGADHDTVSHFMMWQFIGATLFAFCVAYLFEKGSAREMLRVKKYFGGSFIIAFFSVVGGYAILKALSIGPLSGVYAVHPAYTLIAGIFGLLFFKEKLTLRKILLALLAAVGIVLLRIG